MYIFPNCHIIALRFYQCQPVYVGKIYSACPVLLHYCGAFQEWGISKQFMTDTFIGPYKKEGRRWIISLFFLCVWPMARPIKKGSLLYSVLNGHMSGHHWRSDVRAVLRPRALSFSSKWKVCCFCCLSLQ